MKKYLALSIGLLMLPSVSFAATNDNATLLNLLYALLANLEAQIALLESHASFPLTAPSQSVIPNATPIFGSVTAVTSTPACTPSPSFTVATSSLSENRETLELTYSTGCPIPGSERVNLKIKDGDRVIDGLSGVTGNRNPSLSLESWTWSDTFQTVSSGTVEVTIGSDSATLPL